MKAKSGRLVFAIATIGLSAALNTGTALADGSPAQLSNAPNWGNSAQQAKHNQVSAGRNAGQSHAGVGTNGSAGNVAGATGPGGYQQGGANKSPSGSSAGYGYGSGPFGNKNNGFQGYGSSKGKVHTQNGAMSYGNMPMGYGHSSGGGAAEKYGGQGANLNNGGTAGAAGGSEDTASKRNSIPGYTPAPKKQGGIIDSIKKALDWGSGSSGGTTDGGAGKPKGGHHGVQNFDEAMKNKNHKASGGFEAGDYDNGNGGGSGPNATGQFVNKGNAGGGDSGGGQTDQGNSGGAAGRNGTGQYVNAGAINGGDSPLHKPADTTPLNMGKFNNGVTDPKRSGAMGH